MDHKAVDSKQAVPLRQTEYPNTLTWPHGRTTMTLNILPNASNLSIDCVSAYGAGVAVMKPGSYVVRANEVVAWKTDQALYMIPVSGDIELHPSRD